MIAEEYEGEQKNDWISVVAHGGGSSFFAKQHPLTKLAISYTSRVFTLLLPVHGQLSAMPAPAAAETLEVVFQILKPIAESRKVMFLAYSMGALCLIKVWKRLFPVCHPQTCGIFIGAALDLGASSAIISAYWQPSNMSQGARGKLMLDTHGQDFVKTVSYVGTLTSTLSSGLFVDSDEREALLRRESRVFFVQGTSDQPFPVDDCFTAVMTKAQAARRLRLVETDHFLYFSTGWTNTQAAVRSLVVENRLFDRESKVMSKL